ncbi:MAG: endopeptidase La [Acidobacteria bacterium]|nr:endopeptidase La [Acidobacteriota bacterium]
MEPETKNYKVPEEAAVLPVRDTVLFPHAVLPLTIGRESSIALINSLGDEKIIAVAAQRDPRLDNPEPGDLHEVASLALIHKIIKMPNQSLFIFAEGLGRIKLDEYVQTTPFLRARISALPEAEPEKTPEIEALQRTVVAGFQQIVAASPGLSDELQTVVLNIEEPGRLADFVAGTLSSLTTTDRQKLLETLEVAERLEVVSVHLTKELEMQQVRSKIQSQVQDQLTQGQKEYYLREQMKAIQKELGEGDDTQREVEELRQKIADAQMPEEVEKEALKELQRFSRMSAAAAEYTTSRTYLDWLVTLPWRKSSAQEISIRKAHEILDADHYNLEKVKERILEYLSVLQLKPEIKGPILCFVGPPGVGKTSLGKSIARALDRKFVRLSFGGIHDEAEIRGHRRTYIGALPGQIIQGLRRAGTNDPVFMLDEVDKIGRDFRGDPAAALLEALDPEQNSRFRDNYLDVPFDLSKVLFITTANVLDPIPDALRDRMEVLELPGYTEEEKVQIAILHVLRRQAEQHGVILDEQIEFQPEALQEIIRHYTREAGLRNLERNIASIIRKQARRIAEGEKDRLVVTPEIVRQFLGAPKVLVEAEVSARTETPGVAVGLAWTPAGGDVLFVESSQMPGKRGLIMTGHLGQVMQESMQAALTWVRSHAEGWHLPTDFENRELHLHVPAGAIPKDGPSAGITMVTALVSMLSKRRVRPNLAMTGEITLSGLVLPVGGIKEKVLAAKRAGIKEVVLPRQNAAHVQEELKQEQLEGLTLHYAKTIGEVLELALEPEAQIMPREVVGQGDTATVH